MLNPKNLMHLSSNYIENKKRVESKIVLKKKDLLFFIFFITNSEINIQDFF